MPLLNSEYLSNWYTLSFDNVGICIAESFTQAKIQEASNKSAIQGDIGTHIMDIGGKYYTSNVAAPVLIGYTDANVTDVFDLIGYFTTAQSNTVVRSETAYVMKSATIDISTDSVKASANFEGDNRIDITNYVTQAPDNLYARTARFYDVRFQVGTIGGYYFIGNILSGAININFDIDKVYVLGQSQAPNFAIRGYSASGNIKLAITPDDYANYLDNAILITGSEQAPGELLTAPLLGNTEFAGALLEIAPFVTNGRKVLLGAYAVITKLEFSMQQNNIITANVEFAAYFNKDSSIVTNI
ncbi:MAG: hypothetical protein RL621_142 [Bacteroidota bacterium]|jgi:hypothetical protein